MGGVNVTDLYPILWGIPGYVVLAIVQIVKPSRTKQGTEYVLQAAIAGALCFFVTHLLVLGVAAILTFRAERFARGLWSAVFPFRYSFSLLVGTVLVAPAIGVIWSRNIEHMHAMKSRFHRWATKAEKEKSLRFSDVFLLRCQELLARKAPVLLTLDSGKVYMGVITRITEDPNEPERFMLLTPAMSGYRDKDTMKVVYNTDYIGAATQMKELPDHDLLLPVSQVVTLAPFDEKLYEYFLQTGTAAVEKPTSGSNATKPKQAGK